MSNYLLLGNSNQIDERKGLTLLELMILVLIFVRFCDPLNLFFGQSGVYLIYYGLYFSLMIMLFFYRTSFYIDLFKTAWLLILLAVIIFIRSYTAGNMAFGFSDPLRMLLHLFNLLIAYSIFLYVKEKTIAFKKLVVRTALVAVLASIVYSTYYVSNVNYLAVRVASAVDLGVSDFNMVYCLMFIPIIVLGNLDKNKFLMTGVYLLTVFFLFKASFMTAIVLFVVFTGVSLLVKQNKKTKLILGLGVVITSIFVFFFRGFIGNGVISLAETGYFNWVVNDKLVVVGNLIAGVSGDTETLGIRMEKINYTVSTFIKNPLFGIDYSNYNSNTIGGHAQWFDDLARFGIIGFFVWVFFLTQVFIAMKRSAKEDNDKNVIVVGWIIFVIIGFFNPNTMSTVTMMLMCVVPFSRYLFTVKPS